MRKLFHQAVRENEIVQQERETHSIGQKETTRESIRKEETIPSDSKRK